MSDGEQVERPMVTDIVIGESQNFCDFLLKNVPEIESVGITVTWKPPLANLPSVVIKGRQGGLSAPGESVRMLEQLLIGVKYLHSQIDTALHTADGIMAERARALKELELRIAERTTLIGGFPDVADPRS